MSLPRELRDKIYGYLLRIDGFVILRNENPPEKLNLCILRVNHTLHIEASRILYVENPWVYINIETGLLHTLCGGKARRDKGFPGDQPVSMGTNARITPETVATMTLQTLSQVDPTINPIRLVLCLFAIPRLCRILASNKKMDEIDVAVYLNASNAGRMKEARQERLMNWLEETRGFGRARIFNGQGNQSLVGLGALMMSPVPSLQEYFDRASTYQKRALQKEQLGRLSEARYDYQDCFNLSLWSTKSISLNINIDPLDDSDVSVSWLIFHLINAVNVSYAFLLIKLRDFKRALYHIELALALPLKPRKGLFGVDTAFVHGLRDMATAADNRAAYCFLQILWERPGHHGADDAVDEIESRLRYRTGSTARIILHNIEHVLQPFRHQKHGSAAMDQAAYRALVEQWLSCEMEVDSVSHRVRCGLNSVRD